LGQFVQKLMREVEVFFGFIFCGSYCPIFGSVFPSSHLKAAVFRFWYHVRFAGFAQFSLWFPVFVKHDGAGFFGFFCPMHFTVFLLPGSYTLQLR